MDNKKLLEAIQFFNKIEVKIEDVTTREETENHQLCVLATYGYLGKSYSTKRLYYKDINFQDSVMDVKLLESYFTPPVFWLDKNVHKWPKDSLEADIDHLIIDDMIQDADEDFRLFLLQLANNSSTGWIQIITSDGRSSQYGKNFENNNHWHDLILLIKAAINSGGLKIDKKFFSNLVFKWTKGERVSLDPYFGNRKIITDLYSNIKLIQTKYFNMEILNLLNYKKQIILQGPPGTGKTKLAKELATSLISLPEIDKQSSEIDDGDIVKALSAVSKVRTVAGNAEYHIVNVDALNKLVQLRKSTEGENPTSFDKIKEFYKDKFWLNLTVSNDDRRAAAIAKFIFHDLKIIKLEDSSQFKLIQFHPSYSYEDFVRGIIAESKGDKIEYKNVNKIIGKFAADAKKNWDDSQKDIIYISKENKIREYFEQFVDDLSEKITDEMVPLTSSVNLTDVEEDAFRYKGKNGWTPLGNRMLFKDIIQAYIDDNRIRQDIKKNNNLSGLAVQHASYFVRVLNMFQAYITANSLDFDHLDLEKVVLKNYVLIIDEINRANLPAVLGELIYALEYRGEKVESMYAVNDNYELVLPPNLYLIGTMNTADRSVGHIDYAIRRRFAFVDVTPKDLTAELNSKFNKSLFDKVAELFVTNISPEFEKKDVQLGHSYFIDKSEVGGSIAIRLEYEIKPILTEYVKDGILIGENIQETIKQLTV